jgi:hypothetical protein
MIAPGSVVLAFHGAQPRLVVLASTEKCCLALIQPQARG